MARTMQGSGRSSLTPEQRWELIESVASEIANKLDTDIIIYNGSMERPYDTRFVRMFRTVKRRSNVILILVTYGGDPDCAFRIARCLQDRYARFTLYVSGICKSAGTLVALGAHELIVGECGELGPLDVQMLKTDEPWATSSGLTVTDAIASLQEHAFNMFSDYLMEAAKRG